MPKTKRKQVFELIQSTPNKAFSLDEICEICEVERKSAKKYLREFIERGVCRHKRIDVRRMVVEKQDFFAIVSPTAQLPEEMRRDQYLRITGKKYIFEDQRFVDAK